MPYPFVPQDDIPYRYFEICSVLPFLPGCYPPYYPPYQTEKSVSRNSNTNKQSRKQKPSWIPNPPYQPWPNNFR